MAKIGLSRLGSVGTLTYKEGDGGIIDYEIESEDEELIEDAETYLEKERTFKIPESNKEDDYREDVAIPTDALTYFELTLSTLYAETGIRTEW